MIYMITTLFWPGTLSAMMVLLPQRKESSLVSRALSRHLSIVHKSEIRL